MVTFSCPNCGKEYKFKSLPIPDAGADFKCSQCQKTCRIIRKKDTVFCIQGSFNEQDDASTHEVFDSFRSESDDMTAEEIESRLQGLEQSVKYYDWVCFIPSNYPYLSY